jgi:hypothetical protein
MKRFIITIIVSLVLLVGCSNTESDLANTTESVEENRIEVTFEENSFDIKQKNIQFNKEDNSLFLEFETNLPDDTVLNMIVNLWQPDTWEEFAPFNSYSLKVSQRDVEVTVEDGLISYTIDNSQFNELLVPNSKVDVRFFIPVSEEINTFISEQFPNPSDFEEAYSNFSTYGDELDSSYEILSDWFNSELTNAYAPEEIYAYYKKESIPYKELEKNPSKYEGTPAAFTGEVLQIITEEIDDTGEYDSLLDNYSTIRLAIDGDYNNVIYVTSQDMTGMEGVVSEDKITVYGKMTGSKTYESVAGYEITVPSVDAVIYEK